MLPLDHAVELLDRALAYTRVALHRVTEADLSRRTPCADWDLGSLLAHMDDALDAFTEGAGGAVRMAYPVPARVRVASLQGKACALLAAWSRGVPAQVRIGERRLDTAVVVLAAALEVTVHGWDVDRALGGGRGIPEPLARALLPVAEALVDDSDRGVRFAAPRPLGPDAPAADRLLGFLGRDPQGQIPGNRRTGGVAAS